MNNKLTLTFVLVFLFSLSAVSALVINSVSQDDLYPGQSANLKVSVKNNFDYDVEDVSFVLNLENTGFTTSGSSEDSEDEIDEDDKETFSFSLKAGSNVAPGDYNIPYSLIYTLDDGQNVSTTKTGSFGVVVGAETELSYSVEMQDNILNSQGKVFVKIINSGLGDIGFVNVKIVSNNGLEIIGSVEDYVGTVSSDDFESSGFDVWFKSTSASVTALVTYKDFDNNEHTETVTLPVKVYTREKALELGLIKESKAGTYGIVVVVVLVIWFGWRKFKKARKIKKRKEMDGEK